eukprot:TRINITY_DN499_c0_g1_i1.p1 TRINITY_DN499_c0_g1~~TRINITY_DN499_c0_g1_i1.p1  ORF type:complete len:545 (-),score=81.56 TRINITY_DN499_c0_g1_i1:511-2145(-)
MGRIQYPDQHLRSPSTLIAEQILPQWLEIIQTARNTDTSQCLSPVPSTNPTIAEDQGSHGIVGVCHESSCIRVYTLLSICPQETVSINSKYQATSSTLHSPDVHVLEEWSLGILPRTEGGDRQMENTNADAEMRVGLSSLTSLLRFLPAYKLFRFSQKRQLPSIVPGADISFKLFCETAMLEEDCLAEFQTSPSTSLDITTISLPHHSLTMSVKYRKDFSLDIIIGNSSPLSRARQILVQKSYQIDKSPDLKFRDLAQSMPSLCLDDPGSARNVSAQSSLSTIEDIPRTKTSPIPIQGSPKSASNESNAPSPPSIVMTPRFSASSWGNQPRTIYGRSCSEMTPPRNFYCRSPPQSAGSSDGFLSVDGIRIVKTCNSPPSAPEKWAPFVGSFEESILSGRMSNTTSSRYEGFTAEVSAHGMGVSNPKVKIPFSAIFYHVHFDVPYVGSIELPGDGLRVPVKGMIQLQILNPTKTPLKVGDRQIIFAPASKNCGQCLMQVPLFSISHYRPLKSFRTPRFLFYSFLSKTKISQSYSSQLQLSYITLS